MAVPGTHHESLQAQYYRELLDHLDDTVLVLDAERRIAYANRRAEQRAACFGPVSVIGRVYNHQLLFGPESRMSSGGEELEPWALPGFDSMQPTYGRHVVVERRADSRLRMRLDYIPVHSEFGSVSGTGVVFHDETEDEARRAEAEWLRHELLDSRKSVERELQTTQLLLEAADTLSTWTHLGDIAQGLADILVRVTSHARARVDKYDSATGEIVVIGSAGEEPRFRVGERWNVDDLSIATREAIRQQRSTVADFQELPEEDRGVAAGPYRLERALLVPLVWRHGVVGLVLLDNPGEVGSFSEREIELVEAIAAQAAVAIENARLYEVEHGIAETLQETLVVLPTHVPGIGFSRAYESATLESGRVGGDFVDVFHVRGNLIAVTLGDVSGKGIDAAVITSLVRTTLRVHAVDGLPPSEVLAKTNLVIRRFTDVESFVTLWFGLLNTRTGLLKYVSAGHPPAYVVGKDGGISELDCRDAVLGAFDETRFIECQSVLRRGERVVLYSDGVTEARSPEGEFLGDGGLVSLIARHCDVPTSSLSESIMSDVIAFSEGVLRDDAAVLVVEPTKLNGIAGDDGQLSAFSCHET